MIASARTIGIVGALSLAAGFGFVPAAAALEPQPIKPPRAADGEPAELKAPNYAELYEEVEASSLDVYWVVKKGKKIVAEGADVSLRPGKYTVIQEVQWQEYELKDAPFEFAGFYLTRDDEHNCTITGPDNQAPVTQNTWAYRAECTMPGVSSRVVGTLRIKGFEVTGYGDIDNQFAANNPGVWYTIQGPKQQVIGPQWVLSDVKTSKTRQRIKVIKTNPRCMTETDRSRLRQGMSKKKVTSMMGKGRQEAFSSVAGYTGEVRSYQYCSWADRVYVIFSGGRVSGWAEA